MWQLSLVIGLAFSPIAAAMAFLITYEEWSHHQLPRAEVLKRSCQMAGVTLLFFLLVSLAIGLWVSYLGGRA
ncbi:MAG: hypothetical protein HY690_08605 [Chloroflexi bacterium]|nr:hypothetical protein [Chloroflexota bacterium]